MVNNKLERLCTGRTGIKVIVILSLILLCLNCNTLVKAEKISTPEGFHFDTSTGIITWYSGDAVNLIIPESINGIEVKGIGYLGFNDTRTIESIYLPDTITSIHTSAFTNSTSIKSFTVAEGNNYFKSIDGVLFTKDGTALLNYPNNKSGSSYTIPDNVVSINKSAFECNLHLYKVNFPDTVTTIQEEAFSVGLNFRSFILPDSLQTIGEKAFAACHKLKYIEIPNVNTIDDYAFYNSWELETVKIENGLTYIGDGVFHYSRQLKNVKLPATVSHIGENAFALDEDVIVHCAKDSYVHSYAMDNGLDFYLTNSQVYTVQFDSNGGSNGPSSILVDASNPVYINKPAQTPQKNGYNFIGWKVKNSQDVFFFDYKTNRSIVPINSNVYLEAVWYERSFDFYRDSFSFNNIQDSFFYDEDTNKKYGLGSEYNDILMNTCQFDPASELMMQLTSNTNWAGSCYGMAAVSALAVNGDINPRFFQSYNSTRIDCIRDLDVPRDNWDVYNFIQFYFIYQQKLENKIANTSFVDNQSVISAIDDYKANGGLPPVVSYKNVKYTVLWNEEPAGIHAVLAYDYEQIAGGYNVFIYDNNDCTHPAILQLYDSNKVNVFHYVDGAYKQMNTQYEYSRLYRLDSSASDFPDLEQELLNNTMNASGIASGTESGGSTSVFFIECNFGNFNLANSLGQSWTFVDGIVQEDPSDLNIIDTMVRYDEDGSKIYSFYIGKIDDYAITAAASDNIAQYSTCIYNNDANTGFFMQTNTNLPTSIVFNAQGHAIVNTSAEDEINISYSSNIFTSPYFETELECEEHGIEITPEAAQILVTATDGDIINAKVANGDINNQTEYIVSESVGTIKIQYNSSSKNIEIYSYDDSLLHQDQQKYTVVFNSQGGTQISPITDCEFGQLISEPTAPSLNGYDFNGWFTEAACSPETVWNFNSSSIDGDVVLYAKWELNEGFAHTITFVNGETNMQYAVIDGEDFTEIPDIDFRPGFNGKWEGESLENITEDLVITAVYYDEMDANMDAAIDLLDMVLVCQKYNSDEPLYDFSEDGFVNLYDIAKLAKYIN